MNIFTGALKMTLSGFYSMYEEMAAISRGASVMELVESVIKHTKYQAYLEAEYGKEDTETRMDNLKELSNLASRYDGLLSGEGLAIFLEDIALITDADRDATGDDMVSLMTVHLAKGLEFTNVVIAGAEDGLFPHSRTFLEPRELEEERRLMYVALTRAKKRLYITRARERYRFGSYSANPRSKFVKEIPAELIEYQVIEPKYQFSGSWKSGKFGATDSGGSFGTGFGSDGGINGSASLGGTTNSSMNTFASRARNNNVADFCAGTRIMHPQFGNGTIVSLKGDIADIAFSGANKGIKRLNVKIAPIEKI